jgi:hypothetical protein
MDVIGQHPCVMEITRAFAIRLKVIWGLSQSRAC